MKKVIFLTILVLISGCGPKNQGTSTGNPLVSLSMTSSGTATTVAKSLYERLFSWLVPKSVAMPPPGSMVDSAGNTIIISDFWISLGQIEFKYFEFPEASEVDGSEVEFQGPYTIDMLASSPTPFSAGNLVVSQFRRLKYKLKKVSSLPTTAPVALSGNAIFISGSVNGKSFTFRTTTEIEMSVSGANLIGAQNNDRLLLQIKLANLIKKIDFTAIISATNTSIDESNRVSVSGTPCQFINSSATELYVCLMSGFSSEANLGKDLDGNGELEPTEPAVK